jgi:hypothetical protein
MLRHSDFLQFRIDPLLSLDLRKTLNTLLPALGNIDFYESLNISEDPHKLTVDFISESSLHLLRSGPQYRICLLNRNQDLFSFGLNIDESNIDAVLDDGLDLNQLGRLIYPKLMKLIRSKEESFTELGLKNLKNFVSRVKNVFKNNDDGFFTSDFLLNYTQQLVDLEKDLIQADDLLKLEKVLMQFVKVNIEGSKFKFITSRDFAGLTSSSHFFVLPPFRGEFFGVEMNWNDDDSLKLMKRLFFIYTLVNFFNSHHDLDDPFCEESLWDEALDAIPFPVVLLSKTGEVHQHNSLFAKLSFSPGSCLKLKLREKIHINDIPYNIYRRELYHRDQEKILFVFFTESFFLKGDGNLTPSGQELGIITSSIAHELNNPIAGILAALGLLQLDHGLSVEDHQILTEMKNGATRCKQLIETFLGFSRANPGPSMEFGSTLSPIDICYQQAQNLLRFRTVESGIRFSFDSIKHGDFRSQVNPSLLTMTFYLILGELMTLYSHQLLVANKNQIEKVIKGEIIESSHEIQIQLSELNISGLTFTKLIQNLLNIEHFVLQISDYSLRFIYNP